MTIRDEIGDAIETLGLRSEIVEIAEPEARVIIETAERHFVSERGRRWWWEVLSESQPIASLDTSNKELSFLSRICPDEPVWFLASDDERPPWPVYEARPFHIEAVVGESRFFEYAVLGKSYSWLVMENHHNQLIAVGRDVSEALSQLSA
jgi:hypothetical protein